MKSETLIIRLTESDKETLKKGAKHYGVSISNLVRSYIIPTIQNELQCNELK